MFELIAKGRSKTEIADILGAKRNTFYRWLRVGNVRLQKRGPRNVMRSISEEQEQALVQKVMANSSMAQADIKRRISELYGIIVTETCSISRSEKSRHYS